MRILKHRAWVPVLTLLLSISNTHAEDVVINNRKYENVFWGSYNSTTVRMKYKGGSMDVSLAVLPPDLQRRFHYSAPKLPNPKVDGYTPGELTRYCASLTSNEIVKVRFNWAAPDPVAGPAVRRTLLADPSRSIAADYDETAQATVTLWSNEAAKWSKYAKALDSWYHFPTSPATRHRTFGNRDIVEHYDIKNAKPRPPTATPLTCYVEVYPSPPGADVVTVKLIGREPCPPVVNKTGYRW